jgi:tRNA threonylcarbamoyl adenosine modification protein (Sua5/YciO/YrdC/YwlC family)
LPAEVLHVKDFDDHSQLIRKAASILLSGGLVVYPTDTSYGLACDPRLSDALEKLIAAKKRSREHGVPLLFADFNQCSEYHDFGDLERIITRIFWPGMLTLVVTANENVPVHITAGRASIAVRVPNHEIPLGLAREIGAPIVGTSANLTGGPSPFDIDTAKQQLGDVVDLYIDDGPSKSDMNSTIIGIEEAEGMYHIKVYREGQLSIQELSENLKADSDALRYWTTRIVQADM